jgi:DinB family protein
MYQSDLELFHVARAATQKIADQVSDAQAAFIPASGRWSIGEVLDHILLAEQLYRERFAKLIDLRRSGKRAEIASDFSEIDTSILFIPRPMLPFLAMPLQMMNLFVPTTVRETMTRYRLMPAQAPSVATPRSGRPIVELREQLMSGLAQTDALFAANPDLDYRTMRLSHPLMGNNNVLQLLRIMAKHEQRHQEQIRAVQHASAYPKA